MGSRNDHMRRTNRVGRVRSMYRGEVRCQRTTKCAFRHIYDGQRRCRTHHNEVAHHIYDGRNGLPTFLGSRQTDGRNAFPATIPQLVRV